MLALLRNNVGHYLSGVGWLARPPTNAFDRSTLMEKTQRERCSPEISVETTTMTRQSSHRACRSKPIDVQVGDVHSCG